MSRRLNTECDLLLVSFIPVAAVARRLLPTLNHKLMSAYDVTTCEDSPSTYGPKLGCSRTFSCAQQCHTATRNKRYNKNIQTAHVPFMLLACSQCDINQDVNKDSRLKAKAMTMDQTLKTKARNKDSRLECKSQDQGLLI